MGSDSFFTKGNRDNILQRIGQVHTITIYCPLDDDGVLALWGSLGIIAQNIGQICMNGRMSLLLMH